MTSETLSIDAFGASPNSGQDATFAVRQALQQMSPTKAARLIFPPGRYHFWPDRAQERYLFVSNNDEGLKRIAFPLLGLSDIAIDGQGSKFIFHGHIVPFALLNCRTVRLTNFSLDWERTFHNEAEVLEAVKEKGSSYARVDLRIPEQFPFVVERERLAFVYEGQKSADPSLGNVLEYDPVRRETAFKVTDNYGVGAWHRAEQIEADIVRLTADFSTLPTPGNIAVIGGDRRECPGIVVQNSQEVFMSDVTIHHCGGMGVIAQLTENITLERVRVTPSTWEGRQRMVSSTADATHFVNCRGLIEMTDCLFENQQDDATNVHGIYARISQRISEREVEVELVHPQQRGVDIMQIGDRVEFVDNARLQTCHQAEVIGADRLNRQFSRLTLASPLPPQVKPGDAVGSVSWTADVAIQGCTSRANRARGFLLSTPGRVTVENNRFHTPGAALLIAGDANYWFESGAVRDVTIRNNHFDNGNYGVWGRACIDICPEIAPEHRPGSAYHRNITIAGNTFDVFDPRLVAAHSVDGLIFRDNTVRRSTAYAAPTGTTESLDITDSVHVEISGNGLPSQ